MSYTFELSRPLADYGHALREWSVAEVRPHARRADTDHSPPDQWREILDTSPVPLGRTDREKLDPLPVFDEGRWVTELVFYENVNYGDIWPLALLNTNIGHLVVEASGTPEQVERWFRPAAENGVVWSFALTEPGFGSDTSQVATTARRDGDSWVLNGSKIYASNAAIAEFITVFATIDPSLGAKGIRSFVVPRDTPGLTHHQGQRGQDGDAQLGDDGVLAPGLRHPAGPRDRVRRPGQCRGAPQRSGCGAQGAGQQPAERRGDGRGAGPGLDRPDHRAAARAARRLRTAAGGPRSRTTSRGWVPRSTAPAG